ncbi:sel1-repeat-containing protein YbeQ-like [Anneissia japonica]|uniref:sel1-repeat-containing protein YbeQ-like n=1 Tax=Anneissia japonica TaxID=1529436 RepID=UPI00142578E4|nr:sel1-repeat-containing protein YbeQ-like [Anneissia japonica]
MSKMWRTLPTRLFRQYVQTGIQTSGAGRQDEDYDRSITGYYLPQYLTEKGTLINHPVRWYAPASPSQHEDGGDNRERNEQHQNFRCGNFWSSCWNSGNIAEAMGLGSAIVLGLQLSRTFNKDQDEVEGKRFYKLAHAMPQTFTTRKSIMSATNVTKTKSTKENEQKEEPVEDSKAFIDKVARESLGQTYNTLGLEMAKSGRINLAASYFHDGAKAGNSRAQFNLAVCYEYGRGVDSNCKKAAFWYKKAAVQGHAMAQYNYGIFHLLGSGKVKKDEEEAVHWLSKSADQGLCQAQSYLGSMLVHEPNKDLDKGIYYLQEAAKQKDVEATYRLGMCYEEGIGVVTNQAKAGDLYHKAALKGHSEAQCCMGRFHQQGLGGIPADRTEAKAWFSIASENGNKEAKESLASIISLESEESAKENLASTICLESEEHLHRDIEKAPGIPTMHCSHSAPNLSAMLTVDAISNDLIRSLDNKSPIYQDCQRISYLDLLMPYFHMQTSTSGSGLFQIGNEDDVQILDDLRSEVKPRFVVAQ